MNDLNRTAVYVPITSIAKADGGRTRIVTGVAASERLDMDGQRADYEWAKAAAADWFKRWGNVREQHGGVAAGKAISVQFDDQAKAITVVSKAVDPGTIAKLDEGVLTGYSWGAKSVPGNPIRVVKEADGFERVKGGAWAELSYVDHPCNYDCTIAITKMGRSRNGESGGPDRRIRASKVIGLLTETDLATIPGGQDFDAILKALLADIAKRDVSAAERERLGDQGHAIDTGQDHPSYPINSPGDLENAVKAYGRANPKDRAKLRRHIISEAKRLGHPEMIPDGWKSVDGLLKQSMADCGCCDDCGPDCDGSCCDQCRAKVDAGKAAAPGPAGILVGVKALAAAEPDQEYQGLLAKVVSAVEGWSRTEGASVDLTTYATLAGLSKAATEPDIAKRRTFYSTANRADVEQAMQSLHQALGIFMEGASALDADKDQRDNTLTGQDAPAAGDTPGGPGTAPHDGVPGDGNMAFDPELVRDGDPAVRTPDGVRDGRAQGEAGTHTWPPAGDAPGQGPGDQGKGESPGGKGKQPFDGQQQAPDRGQQRGQVAPGKAAKRLKKAEAELKELRKAAGAQNGGQPAIALQQTLGAPGKPTKKGGKAKALRQEIKALGEEIHKTLQGQAASNAGPATGEGLVDAGRLEKRLAKRLRKLEKRLNKATAPDPQPNPLEAQIAELRAVIAGQATKAAGTETQNSDTTLLLMADLTRAAFDQARKDSVEQATWLGKRVRRADRRLRKATSAQSARLDRVASDLATLGRMGAPGGPQIARSTAADKTFPVNDSIERSLSPDVLKRMQVLNEMAQSSDRQTAADASAALRELVAEVRRG